MRHKTHDNVVHNLVSTTNSIAGECTLNFRARATDNKRVGPAAIAEANLRVSAYRVTSHHEPCIIIWKQSRQVISTLHLLRVATIAMTATTSFVPFAWMWPTTHTAFFLACICAVTPVLRPLLRWRGDTVQSVLCAGFTYQDANRMQVWCALAKNYHFINTIHISVVQAYMPKCLNMFKRIWKLSML